MAVHAGALTRHVSVWARRQQSRDACLQADWCDMASGDLEESLHEADLAVLCTPVAHLSELLGQIRDISPSKCLITDVGSTKAAICQTAEEAGLTNFVGSHPIAGSEQAGMEHSSAKLFLGRPCFVTPSEKTDPIHTQKIAGFWEALGMKMIHSSPRQHDRILAHVSHLPHLLASALCNALSKQSPAWSEGSGQGLRDATRIAAGSPTIWRDIAQQNSKEILDALDFLDAETQHLRQLLEENDSDALFKWLDRGKTYRDSLV
jgi:cyclohexadieny/prephenate dehydrogenase